MDTICPDYSVGSQGQLLGFGCCSVPSTNNRELGQGMAVPLRRIWFYEGAMWRHNIHEGQELQTLAQKEDMQLPWFVRIKNQSFLKRTGWGVAAGTDERLTGRGSLKGENASANLVHGEDCGAVFRLS